MFLLDLINLLQLSYKERLDAAFLLCFGLFFAYAVISIKSNYFEYIQWIYYI